MTCYSKTLPLPIGLCSSPQSHLEKPKIFLSSRHSLNVQRLLNVFSTLGLNSISWVQFTISYHILLLFFKLSFHLCTHLASGPFPWILLTIMHKVLVGKPEGKRPLGRPRRRWEDNIKMDLEEVGVGGGDWMDLAQDRKRWRALVSTVMNLRVP